METPTLAQLTDEVHKFNALLQDPQPGLFAWHTWFEQRARMLVSMLNQLGYKP